MKTILSCLPVALLVSGLLVASGCSKAVSPVRTQGYARLKDHRMFEYEFPQVWKAIEATLKNSKVVERDPEEVDKLELKSLSKRSLETDWLYTQSRDKYVEYKVNGSPRRQQLMTRLRYKIAAEKTLGGTNVTVRTEEEIERLRPDGSSGGYERPDEPDSSRADEVLNRINGALLSAAP